MHATLFDRSGGFAAIRKIVAAFYEQVLESDMVGHHFLSFEMSRLVDHQTKFISSLMGGPASFTDEMLHRAHMRLGVTHEEFVEIVDLLRETLEEFDLPDADINAVCSTYLSKEPFIVVRPSRGEALSKNSERSDNDSEKNSCLAV